MPIVPHRPDASFALPSFVESGVLDCNTDVMGQQAQIANRHQRIVVMEQPHARTERHRSAGPRSPQRKGKLMVRKAGMGLIFQRRQTRGYVDHLETHGAARIVDPTDPTVRSQRRSPQTPQTASRLGAAQVNPSVLRMSRGDRNVPF